jgi:hypothetical protein
MIEDDARAIGKRLEGEGFTVQVVHVPARDEWHVVVEDGAVRWTCDPQEQTWTALVEADPDDARHIPDHRMREQLYRAVWG